MSIFVSYMDDSFWKIRPGHFYSWQLPISKRPLRIVPSPFTMVVNFYGMPGQCQAKPELQVHRERFSTGVEKVCQPFYNITSYIPHHSSARVRSPLQSRRSPNARKFIIIGSKEWPQDIRENLYTPRPRRRRSGESSNYNLQLSVHNIPEQKKKNQPQKTQNMKKKLLSLELNGDWL